MIRLLPAAGLIALLTVSPVVIGQGLIDPTAPPAILRALNEARPEDTPRNAAATDEPAGAPEATPQLPAGPSLVVSEPIAGEWRTRAVVGREIISAGDTVEVGEVMRVNEGGLVIATDDGKRNEPVVKHDVIKHRPGERAEDN
ncbi:hypothetical protein [Spiribacter insolitus]|uniref:MSHA biogenesis protein MshK n=1 Tax=Spiribacter insolitus TaxID=3122417 RepID=A0ABV3T8P5_9GAMM